MLKRGLAVATAIAVLMFALPALAQNVTVPSLKPPTEDPSPARPTKPGNTPAPAAATSGLRVLIGSWKVDQKGNPTCSDGVTTFTPQGATGVAASTLFGDFAGSVADIRLSDTELSFSNSYIDVFGDPQTVVWRGRLAEDKNTITGKIEGSWQNGCTFIMRRQ